ncbi:hypothetical protein N8E89_07090 [Phyllobacterium sp. A18/5-2]|uniref:hypothetical protein n=1 Tax=Phyllobacterium sp. A18/5-2 TaxID=2978392 RepID=UPI0021CA1DD2|nr:hypothetical protein [Phyllobacterium sp. A18/5-2]UXN65411.1 hypothetical protein N8E89_07090 [Phyllobacterium sp. A18/5-2]
MKEAHISTGAGDISVTIGGETQVVKDQEDIRKLKDLVAQRQEAGLEISRLLKRHGFHTMGGDEPTEATEPDD